jgi:hypothetical protein
MNYANHYKMGVNFVYHKGKIIATSLHTGLPQYLRNLSKLSYEVGYIPAGYEHRPDLISDLFYDTVAFDWLIMMFNNIKDPFQELNVNDRILIPNLT